jgi:hypothetical protein
MPILSIITIAFLVGISAGGGLAYTYEHAQTKLCEAAIESANDASKIVLAKAEARVASADQAQEINNIQIESEHDKNIELLNRDRADLDNARRLWASHQASSDCTMPTAGNPSINTGDDAEGYWLDSGAVSKAVDGLIQKADTDSADKHTVMQWLNSLPPELIK